MECLHSDCSGKMRRELWEFVCMTCGLRVSKNRVTYQNLIKALKKDITITDVILDDVLSALDKMGVTENEAVAMMIMLKRGMEREQEILPNFFERRG